jgi:multisubunit Na+/H+ antiporter MnhF subunit
VRSNVSYAVIAAFLIVNLATLLGLYLIYQSDSAELRAKLVAPDQRVINTQVVIALLGATTVQLGSMAVIMAKYLFPLPRQG